MEMCLGDIGSVKGDVSREEKLSSQWENQGRCVRGNIVFKEGRPLTTQEVSREMCQGKRNCQVHGNIKGDVSGGKTVFKEW